MHSKKRFDSIIGWILAITSFGFVLLLAGVGAGALTADPPAVSPYATGSSGESGESADVFDTDAYDSTPGETQVQPAAAAAITIADFAFGDPIEVAVGQPITITNNDGLGHTWTARDGAFDSGTIEGGGGTFEFAFDHAGEFEFFCTIHPSMTGSITVEG